jgi:diaminopimelate decarboxylase
VIKQTTSTVFAGVDSGFNHLTPMLYGSQHKLITSQSQRKERFYSVVGYIETDTFANNREFLKSKKVT